MLFARLREVTRTVRFRLMFWTTVVVFVLVGVTLLAVREIVRRTLINDFEQIFLGDFEDVSLLIQQNYTQKTLFKALDQKVHVRRDRGLFIQVFGDDGARVYESDRAPDLGPIPALEKLIDRPAKIQDRGSFFLLQGPVVLPEKSMILRMGNAKESLEDDIGNLNRTMVLAGISILFLAPLGGFVFASRVTMPLARIISTTARLQPEKLEERLPLRGTGDELDQLSKTINGMLDRIANYIDRNRDFIAHAAHELRSPLAAIRSSVEVALNRPRTGEEYANLLTDVMEECAGLSRLVSRLLLLAEGDAGRLVPRDQTTHLDKIVRESIDMFQPVAEAKGLDLILQKLPAALVPGEDIHLRQVVRNLLDNAIKFTSGPGRITVSLNCDRLARRAELRIQDTGQGIAPTLLPRIFDRFFRAELSRPRDGPRGGYGLGLSICQSIVQSLQGDILVTSLPGQGTTFTVLLPLVE